MKRYSLITVVSLIGLMLLACNISNLISSAPTETAESSSQSIPTSLSNSETPYQLPDIPPTSVDPLASAKACLNGTWEINNLSSYVTRAIPTDLAAEYNLEYKDTSGSATVTFSPQGLISLFFNGLIFRFDASVSIFTVPLTVSVDGEAHGKYSLNGDLLTTSQVDSSGLTAAAEAMGQDVIEPAQIISLIPLVQPPFNTAVYTCADDSLQLDFPAFPDDFPPLVFQRVK